MTKNHNILNELLGIEESEYSDDDKFNKSKYEFGIDTNDLWMENPPIRKYKKVNIEHTYNKRFMSDNNFEKEIKTNLLLGNFIYPYEQLHLSWLIQRNDYIYVLYLNKFIDKMSDKDILYTNGWPYKHMKLFIQDACKILNINDEKILQRFTKIFYNNDDEYSDDTEYMEETEYDRYRDEVLENNIETINKKINEELHYNL